MWVIFGLGQECTGSGLEVCMTALPPQKIARDADESCCQLSYQAHMSQQAQHTSVIL